MSCLKPLIRIDESIYNKLDIFNFLKYSNPRKAAYRGGFFYELDYLVSFFENEKEKKNFRDFILQHKGVSVIPCNNCISCRLKYSRDWSIRTYLQSEKLDANRFNYFLTLTYDDLHIKQDTFILPNNKKEFLNLNVLDKKDLQNFMKRFRKKYGDNIKFFACGEYGAKSYRPHYHLILLNCPEIIDRKYLYNNANNIFYDSETLKSLWTYGFSVLSECNLNTIFYTSHYCLKKSGKSKINLVNSCGVPFQNEFQLMSRRPGLAEDFFLSRIYDENKNYNELNVKLKDISFRVSSIKYYNYLFDYNNLWRPINEYKKPIDLDLIYNNSYLTKQQENEVKTAIKYNDIKLLRSSI